MMFKGTMGNFHREAHKGREGYKDFVFLRVLRVFAVHFLLLPAGLQIQRFFIS
jgi:hypothetical protein